MEPKWLTIARTQLGVVEAEGKGNNPSVVKYYNEAQHPEVTQDSVPWCAAFTNAMLIRAGIKGNGSLMARSFESWGQEVKSPILGCIGVKKRVGAGWVGHVGFVVGANATRIFLLGGNQQDKVSIADFPKKEFTAFRWPANIPVPTDNPLPKTIAGAKANVKQA